MTAGSHSSPGATTRSVLGGRRGVFAFIFVVSLGIATAFAVLGAWLILPFAGLEMLVLYLAFRYVDRHAADYERIAIRRGQGASGVIRGGHGAAATSSTASGRGSWWSGTASVSRCVPTVVSWKSGVSSAPSGGSRSRASSGERMRGR